MFTQHITDQMGAAAALSVLPLSNSSGIEQLSQLVSESYAEQGDHRGYVTMLTKSFMDILGDSHLLKAKLPNLCLSQNYVSPLRTA